MSEEGLICSIDLQFTSEAEGEDFFVVTPCGHAFHNSCLMDWLNRGNNTCPMDMGVIDPSNLRPLRGINPSRRRTTQTTNPTSSNSTSDVDTAILTLEDLTLAISDRIPDYTFKIVLLGVSGVGKSSLLHRYTADRFNYSISTTVGVDLAIKHVWIGDKLIRLSIWDPSGQEKFKAISRNFARNTHGAMLVYSYGDTVDEVESLREIPYWINYLKTCGCTASEAAMLLVGNKTDISLGRRGIHSEDGHTFAREHNIPLFETSALDDINVDTVFRAMAAETLEKVESSRLNYVTNEERAADGVLVLTAMEEEINTSCWASLTGWFTSIFSFSSNKKVD